MYTERKDNTVRNIYVCDMHSALALLAHVSERGEVWSGRGTLALLSLAAVFGSVLAPIGACIVYVCAGCNVA